MLSVFLSFSDNTLPCNALYDYNQPTHLFTTPDTTTVPASQPPPSNTTTQNRPPPMQHTIISKQPYCISCNKPLTEWDPYALQHEHNQCIAERLSDRLIALIKQQMTATRLTTEIECAGIWQRLLRTEMRQWLKCAAWSGYHTPDGKLTSIKNTSPRTRVSILTLKSMTTTTNPLITPQMKQGIEPSALRTPTYRYL